MKKILFVFVLGAFAACGGSDTKTATDSTTVVSGSTATMSTDTTTTGAMSTDTTTMSTPH
ncbi:MAG: hypothetical protein M3040_18475 [Bacteroidota bacterium]|nr:hypothetical protein [Bacteroidota bacterium]